MKSYSLYKCVLSVALFVSPAFAFSHARMTLPAPRDTNDGNKNLPCGNTPKPAKPKYELISGQTLAIEFEETIDHPGKYLINFSAANDTGFDKYPLATIADVNGGILPHIFKTTVKLPNIACDNCTLQLVQSMEEDRNNPQYYYSCVDVRLSATGQPAVPPTLPPPTSGGNQSAQNSGASTSSSEAPKPGLGGVGCGRIDASSGSGLGGPPSGLIITLFLLPLVVLAITRQRALALARISRKKRRHPFFIRS